MKSNRQLVAKAKIDAPKPENIISLADLRKIKRQKSYRMKNQK